jgi:D-proline reductase (dithiol) PrdB
MTMEEKPAPLEMSRYCVPYTPFRKRLEESTICLVSTAGVRQRDQQPFEVEGDNSYRRIGGALQASALTFDDAHYDHACVDRDLNCVFPVDRLAALVREGRIAGLTEAHFSLGFSQSLRDLRQTTIPVVANAVSAVRPDAVLLTGG